MRCPLSCSPSCSCLQKDRCCGQAGTWAAVWMRCEYFLCSCALQHARATRAIAELRRHLYMQSTTFFNQPQGCSTSGRFHQAAALAQPLCVSRACRCITRGARALLPSTACSSYSPGSGAGSTSSSGPTPSFEAGPSPMSGTEPPVSAVVQQFSLTLVSLTSVLDLHPGSPWTLLARPSSPATTSFPPRHRSSSQASVTWSLPLPTPPPHALR